MAVILNPDAQVVFFTKVLGATHPAIVKVKALVSTGITFEVSLYAVRAYLDGKKPAVNPVQLSFGTTALMKGSADLGVLHHNQKLIVDWVNYLYEKQGKPSVAPKVVPVVHVPALPTSVVLTAMGPTKIPLIKAVMNAKGCSLLVAKPLVDMVEQGQSTVIGTYATLEEANTVGQALQAAGGTVVLESPNQSPLQAPQAVQPVAQSVAKPVDEVVDLRHAQALGQKVHGTSTGSVYYCIAMSEHVRVAARMSKAGSISIRAEWTDNPTEDLAKLEESGVQMKMGAGYGSIHFSSEGVPLSRTIGAFLMGTGINWTHVVTSGAELVVGS